jgi:aconitate hydratase
MGVLPLQFPRGVTRKTLALDGSEVFDVPGAGGGIAPCSELECAITRKDGRKETVELLARLDTKREVEYYRHGGQLHFVVRDRLEKAA